MKASRFCTNRRVLPEAGESVQRFVTQSLVELKDRLRPINWQFMATKIFDPEDFEAFLKLLPREVGRLPLCHALEVRHDSFNDRVSTTFAASTAPRSSTPTTRTFPRSTSPRPISPTPA